MDANSPSRDPARAQQLVARYAALVEEHTAANAFPAPATTLPAPKPVIKEAVRTVLEGLMVSGQLTEELKGFLEEAFVALANYVDVELAALAAEHRQASGALESDPSEPRERIESTKWKEYARLSRLSGGIEHGSDTEA